MDWAGGLGLGVIYCTGLSNAVTTHYIHSIEERFLLMRKKNLGVCDSLLPVPHRGMFQAQNTDWAIPKWQMEW